MDLTEKEKNSAAVWSLANRSFLEDPERISDSRSGAFAAILRDNPLRVMSPQPWPLFIDPSAAAALAPITLGLDRLVKSVPERFFDNDPARLSAFYGFVDRDLMELIIAEPNGIAGAISRGDYIDSAEGLKVLELNAGSLVGGWQLQALEGLYLGCPPIARFLAKHGLRARHYNTIRLMFRHIVREALQSGVWDGGPLNLGLIIHPHKPIQVAIHSSELYNREYRAALAEEREGLQGEVFLCSYADLEKAAMVCSTAAHGSMPSSTSTTDSPTPAVSGTLNGARSICTAAPSPCSFRISAISRCCPRTPSRRTSSPASGICSRGIFPGRVRSWSAKPSTAVGGSTCRSSSPRAASASSSKKRAPSPAGMSTLESSSPPRNGKIRCCMRWLQRDWIAQEYVESRPYFFLDSDDRVVRHTVIWGLFAFGEIFGGVFLRLQPDTRGGVVNTAGGAEVGLLLEVEPSGAPPT